MTPDRTSPTPLNLSPAREKAPAGPIGFRLDPASRRALTQRAQQFGVSAHELARCYVLERLREAEERAMLREAVTAAHSELGALRVDLALAVEALLVSAGKVPPAEAQKWVEENFHPEAQPPVV
ncbi:MAG: hypothetical protein HZA90_17345 [Verrucomicrobia bacterium]|nr:hypothetical protein [Verrucomicrobiota bacterium]